MIRHLLIILLSFFLSFNSYSSDNVKRILINGNERVSDETIKMFSEIQVNSKINNTIVNEITKKLYETNYFNNVIVKYENNILKITVDENPIIQNIQYNGIKSKNLKQQILNDVNLKQRSSYSEYLLNIDKEIILQNLKKNGFYLSKVTISKKELENNKIDLIYDIDLGDKSKIKKITFLGNKIYKDKKLRNVIISEENRFWKFLSKRKFVNQEIINFDKNLLRNFYLNKGYYDVEISSTFAKMTNDKNFELIFNIDAKNKYFFSDIKLKLPQDFNEDYFENVTSFFRDLRGSPYSINSIEKIIEKLEVISIQEEYQSVITTVNEEIINDKINLEFELKESEKYFIKKINIFGNNVTQENVIRNQFEIDEGDPFNDILAKKSINSIKSLGFFKDVKEEILTDEISKTKIININVVEKPTGEILAGAGIGTSGGTATFSVKENNYLGRGIGLQALATIDENSLKGKFSVSNPNFNNSEKSVSLSVESLETDLLDTSGYKSNRTGFMFNTNFEYLDDLTLGLGQSTYFEKISTNSTASTRQRSQEGNYWDTFVLINADYDKRNQKYQTSEGFRSFYSVDLPLISDTNTLTNTYSYTFYDELYEENISSISFYAKAANSITGNDIKLSERLFLPGKKLRGFEQGKIGPKDGTDYIGGNFVSSVNITSTIPQILPNSENTDFVLFMDIANIWGVDYDSSIDTSNKIRSSIGFGIDWFSILGPINFSLSQALSKTSTDKTETFRFNLGTTF
jgi:outer membrane protein insertion porin family